MEDSAGKAKRKVQYVHLFFLLVVSEIKKGITTAFLPLFTVFSTCPRCFIIMTKTWSTCLKTAPNSIKLLCSLLVLEYLFSCFCNFLDIWNAFLACPCASNIVDVKESTNFISKRDVRPLQSWNRTVNQNKNTYITETYLWENESVLSFSNSSRRRWIDTTASCLKETARSRLACWCWMMLGVPGSADLCIPPLWRINMNMSDWQWIDQLRWGIMTSSGVSPQAKQLSSLPEEAVKGGDGLFLLDDPPWNSGWRFVREGECVM